MTGDADHPPEIRGKLWTFAESAIFWGGAGVLVGGVGAIVSLKVIYIAAGLAFAIAIVRAKFFEGRPIYANRLGTTLLLALTTLVLFLGWKVTPKPKEPPSVEEIAAAVIRKQKEEVHATQVAAPSSPQKAEREQHQTIPRKTPPRSQFRAPREKQQPKTEPPATLSPQQGKLTLSQSLKISTRQDAQYHTEVVVQSTVDFPTLKLVLQCDHPLVDGSAGFGGGGVMIMTSQGIVQDHPNVFLFAYQSATPAFGPINPVVINLWSKEPVKCEAATF